MTFQSLCKDPMGGLEISEGSVESYKSIFLTRSRYSWQIERLGAKDMNEFDLLGKSAIDVTII